MLGQDQTLASLSTPDRVESRLGRLEFHDGAPAAETAETLFDHLTFVRGVDAFLNAFQLGLHPGDSPGVPGGRRAG